MDTYKGYSFLSLEDQISIINENQLESTANNYKIREYVKLSYHDKQQRLFDFSKRYKSNLYFKDLNGKVVRRSKKEKLRKLKRGEAKDDLIIKNEFSKIDESKMSSDYTFSSDDSNNSYLSEGSYHDENVNENEGKIEYITEFSIDYNNNENKVSEKKTNDETVDVITNKEYYLKEYFNYLKSKK